ncbi:hypothetical protein ACFVXE_04270 [Streptomyces sp. NPDC058231]|uniref:hypothetical protein n=1 Tax=Streptomyces sp. NPDC058231 TaxID=3346392 RepID=UPI0036EE441B
MTGLTATGGRDVRTDRFSVAVPPTAADAPIAGSGPVGLAATIEPAARIRETHGTDNVLIRPDQHVDRRGARRPEPGAATVLDRVQGRIPGRAPADRPRIAGVTARPRKATAP